MSLVGFVRLPGEGSRLKSKFQAVGDSTGRQWVRVGNRDESRSLVPLTLKFSQLGRGNAAHLAVTAFARGPNIHKGVSFRQELHQPAPGIEPALDGKWRVSGNLHQGGEPSPIEFLADQL